MRVVATCFRVRVKTMMLESLQNVQNVQADEEVCTSAVHAPVLQCLARRLSSAARAPGVTQDSGVYALLYQRSLRCEPRCPATPLVARRRPLRGQLAGNVLLRVAGRC